MARTASVVSVFVLCLLAVRLRAEVSESLREWHNSVAKPPPSRFHLSCNTSFTIVDDKPLGEGYKKAAWRARDDATGIEFVLKVPSAASRRMVQSELQQGKRPSQSMFMRAVTEEMKIMSALSGQHFIRPLGYCIESEHVGFGKNKSMEPIPPPYYAVEGGLVRFSKLLDQDLPWCYRLSFFRQMLAVLRLLESKRLIHCDLKHDQFMISLTGVLKIIDMESIVSLPANKTAFVEGKACTEDKQCVACIPSSMNRRHTDGRCENQVCVGIDAGKTIAQIVGNSLMSQLFPERAKELDFIRADLEKIQSAISEPDKAKRWSISQALGHLAKLWDNQDVGECMEKNEAATRALIHAEYVKFLSSLSLEKPRGSV